MNLAKAAARGLVAPIMIMGGQSQLKNAEYIGGAVHAAAGKYGVANKLPSNQQTIAKIGGTTMMTAGAALGLGFMPQVAAAVLAGQMVVTTVVGHPFWEKEGEEKQGEMLAAFKNMAITGGLIYIATTKK